CGDEPGTFAEDADLLVGVHANGSESSSAKGFHIIVADPGEDERTEKASAALAQSLGSSMGDSSTPNRAYGEDAISRRPDLAGLNNASVPAVIVECAEMRNPDEAKLVESESGRRKYADALFHGIVDWFCGSGEVSLSFRARYACGRTHRCGHRQCEAFGDQSR